MYETLCCFQTLCIYFVAFENWLKPYIRHFFNIVIVSRAFYNNDIYLKINIQFNPFYFTKKCDNYLFLLNSNMIFIITIIRTCSCSIINREIDNNQLLHTILRKLTSTVERKKKQATNWIWLASFPFYEHKTKHEFRWTLPRRNIYSV